MSVAVPDALAAEIVAVLQPRLRRSHREFAEAVRHGPVLLEGA